MIKVNVTNIVVETTELNNISVKHNFINTVTSTVGKISRKLDEYDYLFEIDNKEIKQ